MSCSAHIDNKKKDILVLGIEQTQALEHTLTTEKMYSINFTVINNLLMVRKFTNLKQKILKF